MTCRIWTLASVAALIAGAALAQGTPSQNGNIYNGFQHEPNPGATWQEEQAAGIGPSQQQQQQTLTTLEQLGKQIEQQAKTPLGTAAGCSANQKACP